jgi:predicted RNA binding protein YcfA (HicA-like mRNA interferase family)
MRWSELIRLLEKKGWFLWHHGGKHDIYRRNGSQEKIVVGRHRSEEVPHGTFRKIIKQSGIILYEKSKGNSGD